jgi:hypothetical protein
MTQRQLNMIHAAAEGIELAREQLGKPTQLRALMMAMNNDMPWSDDDKAMSVARAAYLGYIYLAWKDAGSPDPLPDDQQRQAAAPLGD